MSSEREAYSLDDFFKMREALWANVPACAKHYPKPCNSTIHRWREGTNHGGYTVWIDVNGEWKPEECATLDEAHDTMRIVKDAGFGYRVTREVEVELSAGDQP